jgi:hypothetical protein
LKALCRDREEQPLPSREQPANVHECACGCKCTTPVEINPCSAHPELK